MFILLLLIQIYLTVGMCYTLWLSHVVLTERNVTLDEHMLNLLQKYGGSELQEWLDEIEYHPSWIFTTAVVINMLLFWPLVMATNPQSK